MKMIMICFIVFLTGCTQSILNSNDYTVIDTINTSRNVLNVELEYDVIIKISTSYFFAKMDKKGNVILLGEKIDLDKIK